MSTEVNYSQLFSRNYLYINQELQTKIHQTKIAFFGAGLSSIIAEAATRIGFCKFYIQDGDKVEQSNLNRQLYTVADIGEYKVEALKNKIKNINPGCEVLINNKYLKDTNKITDLIGDATIVINTIDCGETYYKLVEIARQKNKLVLCPFNPGYDGLVFSFTKNSGSYSDIFGTEKYLNTSEIAKILSKKFPVMDFNKFTGKNAQHLAFEKDRLGYYSQIIVGGLVSTAIAVTMMVNYLDSINIITSPNFAYLSTKKICENSKETSNKLEYSS